MCGKEEDHVGKNAGGMVEAAGAEFVFSLNGSAKTSGINVKKIMNDAKDFLTAPATNDYRLCAIVGIHQSANLSGFKPPQATFGRPGGGFSWLR